MNMEQYKLMWVMQYFPCHDHEFPGLYGPHTVNDYWLGSPDFSAMHSHIGLP